MINKLICWIFGHKVRAYETIELPKKGIAVGISWIYRCTRCGKKL